MKKKDDKDIYIGLLAILLSNAVIVYGVFYAHWNFFMVIYSYWFGELISSAFDRIKYRALVRRHELPPMEEDGRFFILFVYWFFIVLIAGFATAPENTYKENIFVILFLNKTFDLNLLFVLLGELSLYLNGFFLFRNYDAKKIISTNSLTNKKTVIMHLSIILGTFVWFSMHGDKFFIHINAGKYGDYVFMLAFVLIRLIGDLTGLRRKAQSNN